MMASTLLIAGREFRAYTLTASFWVALMIGPLLLAGAGLLAGQGAGGQAPAATLTLSPRDGGYEARFSDAFPLSYSGREKVALALESGLGAQVRVAVPRAPTAADAEAVSRFAAVVMLWMTLAGSLGMLLQAVVRERSNRALESLLASARPWEIVLGKLVGVGAVSMLILGAWLGASAVFAIWTPASGSGLSALLHHFAAPAVLVRAVAIYLLAFAFYGLATVAIGAGARDNADAQNLARPMFVLLLVVFFTAMASAGGANPMGWLVYLPPFTPFLLLMRPPGPVGEALALALLVAATGGMAWWAIASLGLTPPRLSIRRLGPQSTRL